MQELSLSTATETLPGQQVGHTHKSILVQVPGATTAGV